MKASRSFTLRRRAESWLAQLPPWYLRFLRWTRCRSTTKRLYVTLIQREDVVFDVGASEGDVTLLFSDLVGPGGEVHAFEPLPPTFARMRETVARHQRFENVRLNNVACAEHACEIMLQVPRPEAAPGSRAQPDASLGVADKIALLPVQAIRLDDYDRGRSGRRLDFVKCDVEGAELLVLRGMMNRLARFRPLVLVDVFAAWTEPFGYEPATLIAFLESIGYDTFYLVADRLAPVCDPCATVAAASARASVHVLCAHSEEHEERLPRLLR